MHPAEDQQQTYNICITVHIKTSLSTDIVWPERGEGAEKADAGHPKVSDLRANVYWDEIFAAAGA
jgi:hypothetical protein